MKAKILALIIGLGMGLVFWSCEKDREKYSGTDYKMCIRDRMHFVLL